VMQMSATSGRATEERGRPLEPPREQVLMRRLAEDAAELAAEMRGRKAARPGPATATSERLEVAARRRDPLRAAGAAPERLSWIIRKNATAPPRAGSAGVGGRPRSRDSEAASGFTRSPGFRRRANGCSAIVSSGRHRSRPRPTICPSTTISGRKTPLAPGRFLWACSGSSTASRCL